MANPNETTVPDEWRRGRPTVGRPRAVGVTSVNTQIKEAVAPAQESNEADKVDKIREILFGGEMRDYTHRLAKLEERLAQDHAGLRGELLRRIESLEAFSTKEHDALLARVKAERADRLDGLQALANELTAAMKGLDARLMQLTDSQAERHRELRQQILDQAKASTNDVRERAGALRAAFDAEVAELRAVKTDRFALADLFNEFALRLKGEMPPTDGSR